MGQESRKQREAVRQFLANMDSFTGGEIYDMLKEAVRHMNKYELNCLLLAVDKTFDDLDYYD